MATRVSDEKHEVHEDLKAVVATKKIGGDEAYQQAQLKEPAPAIGPLPLILACAVAFCCSTTNGFDGSLFSTLLSNTFFREFFGVDNKGTDVGVVTAMYQIGQVVALPFIGPAIDTWGRRMGMFIGGLIIFVGVIIQITCASSQSLAQFMGGRFLLGFGVGIIGAAGPIYVVEICHPARRGVVTGLYNVMWPVGAFVASGAARGGLDIGGNSSWMIPVGLQAMFPGIVVLGCYFLPESPRWHYTRNRREEATATLVRLHGNGNPDSEWVKLQLREYEEFLEMDGTDKRWWDYSALFRNRASVYRLMCNCLVALFGQWAGNGIVSYYLSAFLDTAGIKEGKPQMNVALGMNAVQIVFAGIGASIVDKVGRRPMLLTVNVVCGLCWIAIIVPASIANVKDGEDKAAAESVAPSVSQAMLAWVYLFQIAYSVGWTPLQALLPVEVLSYEMRAKGMAFSSFFMSCALMANQFGVPVALKNIRWMTYIVFCVWCFVQTAILYFLVPETKGRTLEELDHIFASKSPVKASREKKLYEVDANNNVVHIDPVSKA
ncbi:general substrate transporter [Plectosphaerella cucumerina]|uniref:General substrate transporter n=1 Tax=Plectosphaerella cucumerina TaxID=40658 RepID=A0A8K0TKV4_9PEZI|nr:general substrate transporter [Plectosphaerella cucumerina]